MGTVIIIVVLAVIVIAALFASRKHMKGEGGCCGGSSDKVPRKKLEGKIVAKKIMHIEGMHCQNCKNRIERQINRIEGAAAVVNLKKNLAEICMTRPISDEELIAVVERLDFRVIGIENEEV